MTLVDLDAYEASNATGKTAVLKEMRKWEKENPLKEIKLRQGEWMITAERVKKAGEGEKRQEAGA